MVVAVTESSKIILNRLWLPTNNRVGGDQLWYFLITVELDPVIYLSIDKAICPQPQTKKKIVFRRLQSKKSTTAFYEYFLYQGNL